MSPELVRTGKAGTSADIFAVGVTFYELLTGTQPFTADTPVQVALLNVNEPIPAPSKLVPWLPPQIDEIVSALTNHDLNIRPANATKALELVERLVDTIPANVLKHDLDSEESHTLVDPMPVSSQHVAGVNVGLQSGAPVASRSAYSAASAPSNFSATSGNSGQYSTPSYYSTPTYQPQMPAMADTGWQQSYSDDDDDEGLRRRGLLVGIPTALALAGLAGIGAYILASPDKPSQVSIPDVTGKTQDDAVTALDDVGLKAAGISASSSTVPKGQVISQQPTAGTTAKTGDTVTLTISSGS
jgi:non-specific serine/threonine protein kinase